MPYSIYHVTRNLAKHALELDDKLYGSPLPKDEIIWPLVKPERYLKELNAEKRLILDRVDDLVYVMRENGLDAEYHKVSMDYETANLHVYHKFTYRSFHYIELIAEELRSKAPNEIQLNVPKAWRQLNVAQAALADIEANIVRYKEYAKMLAEVKDKKNK